MERNKERKKERNKERKKQRNKERKKERNKERKKERKKRKKERKKVSSCFFPQKINFNFTLQNYFPTVYEDSSPKNRRDQVRDKNTRFEQHFYKTSKGKGRVGNRWLLIGRLD